MADNIKLTAITKSTVSYNRNFYLQQEVLECMSFIGNLVVVLEAPCVSDSRIDISQLRATNQGNRAT